MTVESEHLVIGKDLSAIKLRMLCLTLQPQYIKTVAIYVQKWLLLYCSCTAWCRNCKVCMEGDVEKQKQIL